jgi:hypothetical protein
LELRRLPLQNPTPLQLLLLALVLLALLAGIATGNMILAFPCTVALVVGTLKLFGLL